MFEVGWVGAVTGVCALALGFYNAVVQQTKDRVRVRVDLSWGIATGSEPHALLVLSFVNLGKPEVRFISCGLSLPGDKNMIYFETLNLPATVKSLDSTIEPKDISVVRATLRKNGFSGKVSVRGYVNDATDNKYLSKPLEVDANESDE